MPPGGTSVAVLAPEPLAPAPTGPARRAAKLAETLGAHVAVTLAAPSPSVFPGGPFRTVETGPIDDQDLRALFAEHDVAVVQPLPSPRQVLVAARHAKRLVVDMTAPLALELLEIEADAAARSADVRWRTRQMLAHLALADLVLCTNDRQRDLLAGAALAAGLLPAPDGGTPVTERIAVVPHGLDGVRPPRGASALRTGPLAGDGVRIAIWGGGIWSWLDPITPIAALERLRPSRPDLRLAFVGFEHPDPVQRRAHEPAAAAAREHVRDRGLEDAVVFRPGWLERDDFLAHLADADAGLSLHRPTLEGRYASRTRILDYLDAGLPVVCTAGDTLSGVVAEHGLGQVVAPGDADGCAAAIDALTAAPAASRPDPAALEPLLWPNAARPLVEFCVAPPPPAARPAGEALLRVARDYPAFLRAVGRTGGTPGLARALARRGASLLRGRAG